MSQLRILIELRFRLLLRQMRSRRRRLVSGILLVVIMLPLAGVLGWGGAHITRGLLDSGPGARAEEWIHLLFLAVFVFLAVTPVLGFRGSEFYDITKLFAYPVRQSTVFVAVTVGLLTSGSVLFFLPVLILPLLELPGGAALVAFRMLCVPVFLFLSVSIGQLLVYTLLGFLRSRRFRDLATIVGPLVGAAVYLSSRLITAGGVERLGEILESRPSRWFRIVPSSWISLAAGARDGPGVEHLAPLLLLALPLIVLVVAVASVLQERAFLGEVRIAVPAAGIRTCRRSWIRRLLARFVPDDLRAIAGKELTSLRREPMVKTLLVHQSAFILVPVVLAVVGARGGVAAPDVLRGLHALPALLLFVEQTLILNNLGLEGGGFVMLVGTPVSRRRILMGKNLAHLGLFGTLNTLIVLVVAVLAAIFSDPITWTLALETAAVDVFAGLLGLVVVLALGNLVSVHVPTRLTVKSRRALRQQQSGREGCSAVLLRLLSLAALAVVLAPVAAALFLPRVVPGLGGWFLAFSGPLAILYSVLLWLGSLHLGGAAFTRREERLIAFFGRSED